MAVYNTGKALKEANGNFENLAFGFTDRSMIEQNSACCGDILRFGVFDVKRGNIRTPLRHLHLVAGCVVVGEP